MGDDVFGQEQEGEKVRKKERVQALALDFKNEALQERDEKWHQELVKKIDLFLEERKEEIIARIIQLINIESVSGAPAPGMPFGPGCAQVLAEALQMGEKLGFVPKNYDNYGGTLRYESGGEEIGIFAHLDVVPAGSGWSYEPFQAVMENHFIIGRGSRDDKGAAVAGLYAMRCIKELALPLKHTISLFMGCSEECGMADLHYYLEKAEKLPVFSLVCDGNFPVCYAEKGLMTVTVQSPQISSALLAAQGGLVSNMVPDQAYVLFKDGGDMNEERLHELSLYGLQAEPVAGGLKISATGRASHAAWPEGSENAIGNLSLGLSKWQGLEGGEREIFSAIADFLADCYGESLGIAAEDEDTGRLTHIAGLLAKKENGRLEVNFNIRYPKCITGEELLGKIEKKMAQKGFAVIASTNIAPGYIDPRDPLVQKLTHIYNQAAGEDLLPYYEGGGTYARFLPKGVAYGPNFPKRPLPFAGGRGKAHMPDECIAVQDILDTIKIYVLAILALDQGL